MSQPAIEINNLSKKYRIDHYGKNQQNTIWDVMKSTFKKPASLFTGDRAEHEAFWALKDIDLTIDQGDVVGIIGKNGSGKSTMLKILSRIVEPTSGTIKMRGKVASLLEVGTGFHPELTGRENIYFNGSILGMGRREINSKFNAIVEFSEIEKFLDTPVKFYSSGMYVRLAFAVAAHLDPDILIVDEVLAVGDAAFQKKSLGKMQDVAGQGRTVLFVSHNMGSVQSLCNKSVLLQHGKLVTQGNTDKVINSYVNSYRDMSNDEQKPIENEHGAIKGIKITGLDGEPIIPFAAPIKIVVSFKINKPKESVILGIGLKNISDIPVTTIWAKPDKYGTGSYTATLEIKDLILESGIYSVSAGLSKDGQTFLSASDFNFAIDGTTTNKRIVSTSGSGIILNQPPIVIKKGA